MLQFPGGVLSDPQPSREFKARDCLFGLREMIHAREPQAQWQLTRSEDCPSAHRGLLAAGVALEQLSILREYPHANAPGSDPVNLAINRALRRDSAESSAIYVFEGVAIGVPASSLFHPADCSGWHCDRVRIGSQHLRPEKQNARASSSVVAGVSADAAESA